MKLLFSIKVSTCFSGESLLRPETECWLTKGVERLSGSSEGSEVKFPTEFRQNKAKLN